MGDLFAPSHILLIVLVALLFFGPSKLPELGRAFGKTIKEFKQGARGIISDEEPAARQHTQAQPLPESVEGDKLG